jgi:uncharacterized repeat protein (TIGR01451 family)
MGMKYTKSLRVTPRAYLLAGILFAVWICLLLVQAPPAEAEDVFGWSGTIRYTKTWTHAGSPYPETGSQTTTYNVDGTVPTQVDRYGYTYQPASWSESYTSEGHTRFSCDDGSTDVDHRSGSGSGTSGLVVHFSGTRYQIDGGAHGNNEDFSNMKYTHNWSSCDDSGTVEDSADQLAVGHFSACDWEIASTPEGSAATTLSGKATDPCKTDATPPGYTETYEWNLTRGPSTPEADLAVTQTDSSDPAIFGDNVKYTLTVKNHGPDGATGVKLTDTTPQGTTFVSATPSTGTCSQAGGAVNCDLGSLGSGASATVDIVVTAPESAGTLTNAASASAAEMDPELANNSSQEITTVRSPCGDPPPPLLPTKYTGELEGSQPVSWGGNYTLTSAFKADVFGLGTNAGFMRGCMRGTSSVSAKYVADDIELALSTKGGLSTLRPFLNYEGNGLTNSQTGDRMSFEHYKTDFNRKTGTNTYYYRGTLGRTDARNAAFTPGSNGWPALTWGGSEKAVTKVKLTNTASVAPCQGCAAEASVSASDTAGKK